MGGLSEQCKDKRGETEVGKRLAFTRKEELIEVCNWFGKALTNAYATSSWGDLDGLAFDVSEMALYELVEKHGFPVEEALSLTQEQKKNVLGQKLVCEMSHYEKSRAQIGLCAKIYELTNDASAETLETLDKATSDLTKGLNEKEWQRFYDLVASKLQEKKRSGKGNKNHISFDECYG